MIKMPSSLLAKVAIGAGVSLVAPVVYRVLQSGEPVTARTLIKEGIKSYNKVRIALAETKENLSDLAAEAQAEAEAASEQTFDADAEVVSESQDDDTGAAPKGKA